MASAAITSKDALQSALRAARDTRQVELGPAALARVADVFRAQFEAHEAVVVADANTMRAAGNAVQKHLDAAAVGTRKRFVFDDRHLYAEHAFVERLQASLADHDAIPIAVGAGTINDITKLAAHRTNRPYMAVATAASMDGYTAYGASITYRGSKQTFDCPAPRAVVADIDVIRAAPATLTASGYADLLAKITAGADWIVADSLGAEAIDARVWHTVQGGLREALLDPAAARRGEPQAIQRLTLALLMGGFAMQAAQSSRPASGAEHQFSHLWDMQHLTHHGSPPSHGFKVGVGAVAVARLYENLLDRPLEHLDIDRAASRWPSWPELEQSIRDLFDIDELRDKALEESRAKYVEAKELREQLNRLHRVWPELRERLREQLLPPVALVQMLEDVDAASRPEDIGISPRRLRDSFRLACCIRRRFTVLDLADRAHLLDDALDDLFPQGATP
jgi:glycerol-1-phosphate dehydrogenase [NAD(P)+]